MADAQTYNPGNTPKIEWKTTGTIPNVKLQYSVLGDFSDALDIATVANTTNGCSLTDGADTGCYNWTVNDMAPSTTVKIRVIDSRAGLDNLTAGGKSTYPFTLRGILYLNQTGYSPTSSDVWVVGSTTNDIKWHSTGSLAFPNDLKVQYSKSGGVVEDWTNVLSVQVPAVGATGGCTPPTDIDSYKKGGCYRWSIAAAPDPIAIDSKVRVIKRNADDSVDTNVTASSDPFDVKGALSVSEPGTLLHSTTADDGTNFGIVWSATGTMSVNLYYRINGAGWNLITTGGPVGGGTSPYSWATPGAAVGKNVQVKVADAAGGGGRPRPPAPGGG